jgi:uncharacterized Zn finger protein
VTARPDRAEPGHTWWGSAWLEALEQRAKLDPNRLPRGRDYAASGAVGDLVFAPGEARARVQGRKTAPYEIKIRVRRFDDDEWGRVLDSISTQLGRAAALLDGELPPEVADDVAAAGLGLLPGPGEIGPRCSCPDDADPCKHSAAVCYLLADALDADPFVVFLLRGRTRAEVLAGLRSRRRGVDVRAEERGIRRTPAEDGTRPAGEAERDPGVDARAALGRASRSGPIPIPPLPPARPGHPAALPTEAPPGRRELRDDLLALASDTARRAWELASGLSSDGGLLLDVNADLARRADHALGTRSFARLAEWSGVDGRELARRALAWRHGGAAGLELLTGEWDPLEEVSDVTELLKAARVALREATQQQARVIRNRITAGRMQLRLGRDLLWYPYLQSDGEWEPAGPPQSDPARATETL